MNFRHLLATLSLALGAAFTHPAIAADTAVAPDNAPVQVAAADTNLGTALAQGAGTSHKAATGDAVDNPYGLDALWKGGDFVARSVLVMMLIMSMGSWYIIVVKALEQARLRKHGRAAQQSFRSAASVQEGAGALHERSAYRFIAESGIEATRSHNDVDDHMDMNTWITTSLDHSLEQVNARMQGGLSFLATVGSTAPFVGLFGTVWGIYHALTAIGVAGQASIDKVAGPVGEALIMTAIGLAVAVPAVLGYNYLVRRNKTAMDELQVFGNVLYRTLLRTTRAKA
ncbi:MotA/TolQ/ExbB proton channel family protein [Niveibacterium umoris]|uniref:Biopolymer transport protein ExbB n=1 Tax=Niveibacterium umoris TaxID=1193620 RepID=A0A840BDL8_9RHOO|nr:MotA/TolQ/ExbB proton channel family protein [Niveibacterium umoris]MBB4010793.1 biopolymer transport protein ExbB [Niveibacterium umoris]